MGGKGIDGKYCYTKEQFVEYVGKRWALSTFGAKILQGMVVTSGDALMAVD